MGREEDCDPPASNKFIMTNSLNSHDAGKAWVLGSVLTIVAAVATGTADDASAGAMLLSMTPQLALALLIIRRRGASASVVFRLKAVKPTQLVFPAAFAISLVCLETLILEGADILTRGRIEEVAELFAPDLPGDTLAATMAFAVLLVPLLEELTFRGFFMSALAELGIGWAVLVPSALFALGHGPLTWMGAFVGAVASSIFVLQTGSILPAIVAHAATNLFCTALPLIHDILPGSAGDSACLVLRLAGVALALLFIPQYRQLWADIYSLRADIRGRPWRETLGYLLRSEERRVGKEFR